MFGWSLTFTCCLYLLKEGKLNLSEMFEPSPEQFGVFWDFLM